MKTKVWRYCVAALFLLLAMPLEAQQFFNLTAEEVKIDSVLPRFVYSKPLSDDYQDSIYTATVKYAEYVDMTVADIANYNRLSGAALPSQVAVNTNISVCRKKGSLVVSFCPLVFRNNKYQILASFMLDVKAKVVVVAYGVRKKGTIAGSVSAVKAEKIENVPAASFDQALQGQSTGLQVIASSGEPSKAATFQIRGTNSINSGKSPLFILDGVPISSSDFNTLSPNDIESISVLKDASSTSIYGARAANGVVVITSKRGLAMDKAKITLRAQYGFSELAHNNWKMMNTDERILFEKEVGLDAGKDYNLLSKVNVNWLDEVFNDRAPLQSYELSINRATDRLNYYVSGGFYDQDGIAQNSTFRRYNIRTNADVKASKWLKVGTNTMAAYEEAQQADDGSYTTVTPISACRFMLPYRCKSWLSSGFFLW